LVGFFLGRRGEGSQHLGHRLDGREFLPFRLADLQFVDALAAWLDRAFVAANGCVVRLVRPLEAFSDIVEMPDKCADPIV